MLGLGTSPEQDYCQGNCQQWPALPKPPSPAAPCSVVTPTPAGGTHAEGTQAVLSACGCSTVGAAQEAAGESSPGCVRRGRGLSK